MLRRALLRVLVPCAVATAAPGATLHAQHDNDTMHAPANTLTAAEKKAGWTLLFDGKSLAGWHLYQSPGVTTGWEVQDGTLIKTTANNDLVSDRQFGNFEMTLEWKLEPKGNSGIFFWATEQTEKIYHNAPEIQVLDNIGHRDGLSPMTSAGALYGLFGAATDLVKPLGEWNSVRVVAKGSVVDTWFNGTKIAHANFDSAELKAAIAKTKFSEWPEYGTNRRGSIGLQEHGNKVWYRNIKIREIK